MLRLNPATSKHTKYIILYLAKLIKLARKEKKLTMEELAERLNISRGKLQRIEKGDLAVQIGSYIEACVILGIPLLGGDSSNAKNLSQMLSYMNNFVPKSVRKKQVDDNF